MPKDCCKQTWEKVREDEPVFIIRGKDLLAPNIVRAWIATALLNDVPTDKLIRSMEHLQDIEDFQREHPERCKIPD